jgi:putative ATP-binding cassette transporter
MNLLFFLLRSSWGIVVLATAIGLLGGACNAGLLALINTVLNKTETMSVILVLGFVGLALLRVSSNAVSQYLLSVFAHKTTEALRQELSRKILFTPLRHLEKIGIPRLLVALTDDVMAISLVLRLIPRVAVDVTTLVGCFVYLGWLSWTTFLAVLGASVLAIFCHKGLLARALRYLQHAREEQDALFHHFRALTEGIKELCLHAKRREAFFSQYIYPTTEAFQHHNVAASRRFIVANAWNQLFFIVLIGLVLIALPAVQEVGREVLTGYVLTILYLMGPMRQVMNNLPTFGRANVALRKIDQLQLPAVPPMASSAAAPLNAAVACERLELKQVVFSYHQEEDNHFILGPLDLALQPGELVFIAGGNGSGKSTLVKLLTGLYIPEAGELQLDGQRITDANREWYRQHFSAVFSDFFLFESFLGLASPDLDGQAQDYLVQLQLDHKVQIKAGVLSTTALSQGQRKRLALLTAYLEDRSIYVFDEWAADQDPQFKEVFYMKLLPALKARGKVVVVISHDDRYFYMADRLMKLDYGRIVASDQQSIPILSDGFVSRST